MNQIGVIPNGVDTNRFCPASDKSEIRRQLDLPLDTPIIICVARLSPEKDLGTLLHAFKHVLDSWVGTAGPAVRSQVSSFSPQSAPLLLFVGAGPEQPALETLACELNLTQHVNFLGLRHDTEKLLRAADVFALSSLSEGLSIALIEAAATGLPIVATDVGGNQEVINPPECGILVPPQDHKALAEVLLTMFHDPEKRKQVGLASRARAMTHFSSKAMVQQYQALYNASLTA